MSQFEYVTTLASFIVAFGVSRLLAGWVHQFLRRRESPPYPLQWAVSGLLLLALLQNSWAIWIARKTHWTFGTFSLLLLLQLALVGSSALINPPPDHASSIREYYFDVRKAVFGLCAVWIVVGAIFDSIGLATGAPGFSFDPPYVLMYSIRGVAFLVFVFMAWSDRQYQHWAGFAVAAILQIAWILGVSYNPGTA